ncbi:MAG: pyridoxamine kinase [Oscillospiraceae bacterium]|nr:pyridoxamine kinase [Oscillospiraceae bacterium]
MRVAAIHDLSGFGRCSLTVIIPVLSAMGVQVCPVPTAVLSTHTGGFDNMVFKDLTDFIKPCYNHYKTLGIEFDAVYSGFLASEAQIDLCLEFFGGYKNALKIVDPVMGDYGKPYKTYTGKLCERMSELVRVADVVTPNLTEAAILLGEEYTPELSCEKALEWLKRLNEFVPSVVITGVSMNNRICNIGLVNDSYYQVDYEFIPEHYPGTGDIFASVLTGELLRGNDLSYAMKQATVFSQTAVQRTYEQGSVPRNGVMIEEVLPLVMGKNE